MRCFLHVALCSALASIVLILQSAPLQGASSSPPAFRIGYIAFAAMLPPPVDRLEIRQAVAHAIDRQTIAAFMPGAVPALGINHPKLPGYNPQVKTYEYAPAQAKALVTRVGWDPQSVLRIYLATTYRGSRWDQTRLKIIENLGGAGIKAEFVLMSFDAIVQLMRSGGGASYLITWVSDRSDFGYPYFSLGVAHGRNYQEDAAELMRQFEQSADPAAKQRIAQNLEQFLLDRALIVPLFFSD